MKHNDTGFVHELSMEMHISDNDAARIIATQGLDSLNHLKDEDGYAHPHTYSEEITLGEKKEMNTAFTPTVNGNTSDKLLTPSYLFDIAINFLVYIVHFQLMLWSTSYALATWDVPLNTAGLASGLFIVGALFARIPAGRYIDFVGRRKLFLGGTLSFFGFVLLYKLCPNVYLFMLIRLLHGMAFGTTSTAASTIVAALVPIKKMGTGIGYFTLGVTLASAVGPFVGLYFVNSGNFDGSLIVCSALTLTIFVLSMLIKVPERTLTASEKESFRTFRLKDFVAKHSLGISLVAFVGGVCYSTVLSYLGEYTVSLGIDKMTSQIFFICFAATSFLSRPITGWLLDNKGGNVVLYPSFILLIGAMLALGFSSGSMMLLAGGLLLGGGYGSITAACHALAVHCSPSRQMGVATSTYFVLLDLGIGVGPYCLGLLVPAFGFSAVYFCAGIVSLIGLFAFFLSLGRFKRFSIHRMNREKEIKTRAAARLQLYAAEEA